MVNLIIDYHTSAEQMILAMVLWHDWIKLVHHLKKFVLMGFFFFEQYIDVPFHRWPKTLNHVAVWVSSAVIWNNLAIPLEFILWRTVLELVLWVWFEGTERPLLTLKYFHYKDCLLPTFTQNLRPSVCTSGANLFSFSKGKGIALRKLL